MGSDVNNIKGFQARGGEISHFNPDDLTIVGLDVRETADNWFAHCARLGDIADQDLVEYAESILAAGKVDHVAKAYRDGDALVLLDGRSTTRAARIARSIQAQKKVPPDERVTVRVCVVRGDPDELHRVNLDSHKHRPLTRTQEAKGYLGYYQHVGEDVAKTAAHFRVDPKTVRNMLAHFDLSPAAQRAIDQKEIPANVTRKLAKLPRAEQDKTIADMKSSESTKGAAAREAVERASRGETVRKPPRVASAKARAEIAMALVNGEAKGLDAAEKTLAVALAAAIRRLNGETGALAPWPRIAAIVDRVLAGGASGESTTDEEGAS